MPEHTENTKCIEGGKTKQFIREENDTIWQFFSCTFPHYLHFTTHHWSYWLYIECELGGTPFLCRYKRVAENISSFYSYIVYSQNHSSYIQVWTGSPGFLLTPGQIFWKDCKKEEQPGHHVWCLQLHCSTAEQRCCLRQNGPMNIKHHFQSSVWNQVATAFLAIPSDRDNFSSKTVVVQKETWRNTTFVCRTKYTILLSWTFKQQLFDFPFSAREKSTC